MRKYLLFLLILIPARSFALNCAGTGSCFLNLGAVGCDGNTNTAACWTTTSGGAAGLGVPTATDNCNLDGSSGAGTATVNATLTCINLNETGFTGTLAGSSAINASGNITLAGTITYTGTLTLGATSGTQTFTSNGKTFTGNVTQNGAGGKVLQADAMNLGTKTLTVSAGTFDTGNNTSGGIVGGFALTAANFTSNNGSTRTLYFNASTITINVASGTAAVTPISIGSTATVDYGHSTFVMNNNSATAGTKTTTFAVGSPWDLTIGGTGSSVIALTDSSGLTHNNLTLTNSGGATININAGGAETYASFDSSACTCTINTSGSNITFTGSVWKTGSGTTWSSGAIGLLFTGAPTITTAGISYGSLVRFRTNAGATTMTFADDNANFPEISANTTSTLDITGRTITAQKFIRVSGSPTFTLTNANLTLSATGTSWDATSSTINASGSVIKLTNATSATFAGAGATYGTVWCSAGICTITGANTMLAKGSADATTTFPASTITTLSGMTSSGTSGHNWVINSSSSGTQGTIKKTGAIVSITFASIKDSRAEGTCFVATSSTNTSGNTGWVIGTNTPLCPTGSEFGGGI